MRTMLVMAFALLLGACSEAAKQSFDESFKAEFEKSFVKSCTEGAAKSGAPAERMGKVTEICTCTAKGLLAKHTPVEITAIVAKNDEAPIKAAAQDCMR